MGREGKVTPGDDLRVEFDLAPLTGLATYQLRVSENADSALLQFDPHLAVIGTATIPV